MSESAYRIHIEDRAERELKSFEKKTSERIARRIDQLFLDPCGSNCKPLKAPQRDLATSSRRLPGDLRNRKRSVNP